MLKKIIAFPLAMLLMLACFTGCDLKFWSKDTTADTDESIPDTTTEEPGTTDENTDKMPNQKPVATRYSVTANTPGIKVLGVRHQPADDRLDLDWACSGLEFAVDLEDGNIRFDFSLTGYCNLRVWIDGQVYMKDDDPIFVIGPTYNSLTLTNVEAGQHMIRLVKINDYSTCRISLGSITFIGTILENVTDAERYIEFVGDEITTGLGNVGNHGSIYEDQDSSLTYAYMLAQAVNADYSITALNGQGLITGNPGLDKAYLYADPFDNMNEQYAFARKANLVVVNVGTVDFSRDVGEDAFKAAYLELIEMIREKNGAVCNILCLYNAVNDTYKNAILAACEEFGGEAEGVYTFELARAAGVAPTAEEHAAYAEALRSKVNELSTPFTPAFGDITSGDGDKDFIDWNAGADA